MTFSAIFGVEFVKIARFSQPTPDFESGGFEGDHEAIESFEEVLQGVFDVADRPGGGFEPVGLGFNLAVGVGTGGRCDRRRAGSRGFGDEGVDGLGDGLDLGAIEGVQLGDHFRSRFGDGGQGFGLGQLPPFWGCRGGFGGVELSGGGVRDRPRIGQWRGWGRQLAIGGFVPEQVIHPVPDGGVEAIQGGPGGRLNLGFELGEGFVEGPEEGRGSWGRGEEVGDRFPEAGEGIFGLFYFDRFAILW